jgi:thiamine-monophosphate kinase
VSVSDELAIRLAAATAGDDYQLLFAASPDVSLPVPAIAIGRFEAGEGISLSHQGRSVPLPSRLGFLHGL